MASSPDAKPPQKCPTSPASPAPQSEEDINKANKEIICKTLLDDKSATAPFDPRFPNTNQTRYCYQMYIDFYRCSNIRGEEHESCKYFQKNYKSLCPNMWIEHWEQLREKCAFPGIE